MSEEHSNLPTYRSSESFSIRTFAGARPTTRSRRVSLAATCSPGRERQSRRSTCTRRGCSGARGPNPGAPQRLRGIPWRTRGRTRRVADTDLRPRAGRRHWRLRDTRGGLCASCADALAGSCTDLPCGSRRGADRAPRFSDDTRRAQPRVLAEAAPRAYSRTSRFWDARSGARGRPQEGAFGPICTSRVRRTL